MIHYLIAYHWGGGVFFLKGSLTSKVDMLINGALGGNFELVLRQKKNTKSKNCFGVPQNKKGKQKSASQAYQNG